MNNMIFDPGISTFLQDLMPWADLFFRLVTEMGSEIFYVSLILIGYWVYRKKAAVVAALLVVVAYVANYWVKYVIANPRPPTSVWVEGVEATNYSTPSGHAQVSATLYGWLNLRVKTWWMTILSIVVVLLIGISRVYIGVHYLGDVLLGWAIGIVTVILFYYLEGPFRKATEKVRHEYLYFILFLIGFTMLIISILCPQPPGDNFGSYAGLLMGLAIALPLEQRFVGFEIDTSTVPKWRLVLRVVLGLVLVLGVMLGLSPFLPTEEVLLRAFRYFLVVLTGTFLWPLIFTKAKI
ncbi:MAG: phosphatase PAP2 family protein [Candidatus Thorarchaeota archaeon]|nr:phosphatase PAP2 family protein [Candidatus Thorarchaeota archaeon]